MSDETTTTSALSNPGAIEPTVIPVIQQNAMGTQLTVSFEGTVTRPGSPPSEQQPSAPSADAGSDEEDGDENA